MCRRRSKPNPNWCRFSSAWSTREGAPLGKNRYVELEIKKGENQRHRFQGCASTEAMQKMTEAVVMDGGRRGELVKVCADPSCRVHHPDTPSPEQVAKNGPRNAKRIEKSKTAITIRHCVLAKVLERVVAPMKKADLLTVAQYHHRPFVLQPSSGLGEAAQGRNFQNHNTGRRKFDEEKSAPTTKLRSRGSCSKSVCSTRPISAETPSQDLLMDCRQAVSGGCRESRESSCGRVRSEARQSTSSQDKAEA